MFQIGEIQVELKSTCSQGGNAEPSRSHPLTGRHFGRFELLRHVYTGSTGTVYLARESDKGRNVALKILKRDYMVDDVTRKRFERGVRAVAPLAHPGIVQLYATGKIEGQSWLSMEWVEGPSVRDLLATDRYLSLAETVRIMRGTASAVETIAAQGVVHRNIQPSSILTNLHGESKLTDFVLARRVDESNRITHTGEVVGDAEYLAPECFRDSHTVDFRADLYSLGVCMYTMLTGSPPFREANFTRLVHRVLNEPVAPPSQRRLDLPPELELIVLRCLAKEPQERFESPRQLFESLAVLGDLTHTPVTIRCRGESVGEDRIINTPSDHALVSIDDSQDALPSGSSPSLPTASSASWRRLLIVPSRINRPARRPWTTLIGTIAAVVGFGSIVLFGEHLSFNREESVSTSPHVPASAIPSPPELTASAVQRSIHKVADPEAHRSKNEGVSPNDPDRLVVQPGTPLRNISDAVQTARNGQVIEVASNDIFRGELKVPAKTLTIVAHPEFRPTFRNTLRINGGGSIRLEGFHFEPYLANKPAIEVEKMPERLEIIGCTFRAADGVVIAIQSQSAQTGARSLIAMERTFAAGNIIFGIAGVPPDLQMAHCCLVADQTIIDWQFEPNAAGASASCDWSVQNNTLAARSVLHVRIADQQRAAGPLPRTSIQIDDNIFSFPQRYRCAFFRWEAWQQPDIPLSRFVWSGSNNAFSGSGSWSMATTMVLSDPAATPQVAMESTEDWQLRWAEQVVHSLKLPAEFRYSGLPKKNSEIMPADFELAPQSKQREMARNHGPLGADVRTISAPPSVP
jgi:serine/threonine protein kinase